MSDENESEFGLVMPFVTVTSVGGPHDDEAYAAGWAMGRLDAQMAMLPGEVRSMSVPIMRVENTRQADLIAMNHGFKMEVEVTADGWCEAKFTRTFE